MKPDAPGFAETAQEQDNGPHMPTQCTLVTSPARKAAALVSMACMNAAGDHRHLRRSVFDSEIDETHPPGDESGEGDCHDEPGAGGKALGDHDGFTG